MSGLLKRRGLSVLLIAVISLCLCIFCSETKAYAADKQTVYFDNTNTQFEEVYIVAENSLGNWTNYQFTASDDSEYLSVQIPASGRKSEIIVKGGQNIYLGSSWNGEGTISFHPPTQAYDLYDTNKLVFHLNQFGGLECDSLDTYQPEEFTVKYNDNISPFGSEETFNETSSSLSKLTIDGKDVLDEKANKEGVGWRYDGQFLYLGECAPFNSTIEAEGDLSIIAVGSENTLKGVTVSDKVEITCECGIVHLAGTVKSKNAIFNVSSYGVIYYDAIVDSENVVFNAHPLGRHIVYGNSSYSKGRIQCKQFTANNSMIDVIFLGGGQVGIYCMDSCENNNSTIGSRSDGGGSNNEVYCAATDDITSAFFDNTSRHSTYLLHFPTDPINVQTKTDGKNGISLKRSKTTGQILSVEMDYYNHCFSDWKVIQKASCVETGLKERECVVCHETETEIIAATDHKWNSDYTVDKKATYAAAGSKSIHCSTCNAKKPGSVVSIPKLKLATPTVSKPKALKKGFTVKWKKVSAATGYEVQYALNSKFTKSKKIVKIKKAATVSKKITKLKAKKKYYVRVRAYKIVSGKTYYSAWCKTKTVTTKK